MSGLKSNTLGFLNTLFKQEIQRSRSQTTDKKDNKSTEILNKYTQNNIRVIADNLVKLNRTLTDMYNALMRRKIDFDKPNPPEEPTNTPEEPKKSTADSNRLSKKNQKKIGKAQKKTTKITSGKEGQLGSLLGKLTKTAININKSVLTNTKLLNSINRISKDTVEQASKYITGSSIKIDSGFRAMQLGMGLSNQGAMSLKGAMDKIGIDQSDLAYLTQGQRDALSDLTGMFNSLYDVVDMSAISRLGNDIYMMQAKYGMIQEAIKTNVMNILTAFTPLIESITDILGQVFNAVNDLFSSPEMKQLVTTITQIVTEIVNNVMPIIKDIIDFLKPILTTLMGYITNLINTLMPVINIIANFLSSIFNIVQDLMHFIKPILDVLMNTLGEFLQNLMPAISTVLQVISTVLTVVMNVLKPIISSISESLNTVMGFIGQILNTLQPLFELVTRIFEEITPILNVIGNILSQTLSIFNDLISLVVEDILGILKPILELITTVISPILKVVKPLLTIVAKVMKWIYSIIAVLANVIIAIRNAVVWWDKKDYLDPEGKDLDVDVAVNNAMKIDAKSGVASTYAGSNNTSSISNKNTNVQITAEYNQTVSGTASGYAQELSKQNYESTEVLANLVEGALG